MQPVIGSLEANALDRAAGADPDTIQVVGDQGIGPRRLFRARRHRRRWCVLAPNLAFADEGLRIEDAAAHLDIPARADESDGDSAELGLAQHDIVEGRLRELPARGEPPTTVAREVTRLKGEG